MSLGIKVSNSSNVTMSWNLAAGFETGIDIDEVQDSLLHGNILLTSEIAELFGESISDVARAIIENRDEEGLAALGDILVSPKHSVSAWVILASKYGQSGRIGNFVLSTLAGVLSQPAYLLLKQVLHSRGINLP